MGGGAAVPTPATSASNHHAPSPSPYSPAVSPNLRTQTSNFIDQSKKRASGYSNQASFGPVPSPIEVQNAIFNLQRVMNGFYASHSELDEIGEITYQGTYDSSRTLVESLGQKRFLDAYHLLETDPLVQRLVMSISSDAGVWDAILKNDAVQDLQESSSHAATKEKNMRYKQEPESASPIIKWIFAFLKSRIIEFVEKLELFVFETLHSMSKKKSTLKHDNLLQEKIQSSLLLSVVVLVIVVVTRSIDD